MGGSPKDGKGIPPLLRIINDVMHGTLNGHIQESNKNGQHTYMYVLYAT